MDFIAIGDTAVDEFIRLKDAKVTCDIDSDNCTISMKWGDKIPFEYAVLLPGVGNAANAAVAAARLGISTGFISNVGNDAYGKQILETFTKEGIATDHVTVNQDLPTNHHYVLWFESERTILVRQEAYPYTIAPDFVAPKWLYLSSMGAHTTHFHAELATWLAAHPETKLAFQPGTFQMSMDQAALAPLYARTEIIACNKQEAERILGIGDTDIKTLLAQMHALGPKTVIMTDGPKGAYASDGTEILKVPMYPDPKPPFERTGAGDACTSTIVVALSIGKPLREALLWGPVNSMAVVQEIGAQKGLLTRDALEKFLADAPADYKVESL